VGNPERKEEVYFQSIMPSIFVTINGVISGCISGFGGIGNILIIVAFLKTKHLQTVNNIFLFQLAIVDFTKAVFILTVKTYTQLSENHYINGFYCPFSGFLSCVTFIHSALLLAAIAVVRYVKIVKSVPICCGRSNIARILL